MEKAKHLNWYKLGSAITWQHSKGGRLGNAEETLFFVWIHSEFIQIHTRTVCIMVYDKLQETADALLTGICIVLHVVFSTMSHVRRFTQLQPLQQTYPRQLVSLRSSLLLWQEGCALHEVTKGYGNAVAFQLDCSCAFNRMPREHAVDGLKRPPPLPIC